MNETFIFLLNSPFGVEHSYSKEFLIGQSTFETLHCLILKLSSSSWHLRLAMNFCYILTFWPGQKCHSKVMHRKEVTHSNGSYERKLRGRKLADKMGQAKKSHDTLIDWRTGREWPLNCMTVISAWWRLNIQFQRSSGRRTII